MQLGPFERSRPRPIRFSYIEKTQRAAADILICCGAAPLHGLATTLAGAAAPINVILQMSDCPPGHAAAIP